MRVLLCMIPDDAEPILKIKEPKSGDQISSVEMILSPADLKRTRLQIFREWLDPAMQQIGIGSEAT